MSSLLFSLDVVSTIVVSVLGIGLVVYGIVRLYIFVFELLLTLFRIKKEFFQYVRDKNKPKVFTPKIMRREKNE